MTNENASYISLRAPNKGPFKYVKNPHVTLAFFKDTSPEEIREALPGTMGVGPLPLEVTGAGIWAGQMMLREPYWIVYASVDVARAGQYLRDLREMVLTHTRGAGLEVDTTYDFTPHITTCITEDINAAREQLPLRSRAERFSVDTLYISRPGRRDEALTVDL